MRTVDPAHWSKKAKGRQMALARPLRFGRARRGFEARLRDSWTDAVGEFWRNCSLPGVRSIVCEDTCACERYRWILLLSFCLVAGLLTLSANLVELMNEAPLVINLQSSQHSVRELPFPAVALCSFNVISQRALKKISTIIMETDNNRTYSPVSIRRNLLNMGALATLALPAVDLQFAHYLHTLRADKKLNITGLMLALAPTCDSLLQKCSWAGKEKPCDRLFGTRITSVGVCCVFNGHYEDADRHTPPHILKRIGSDNGLSVIIRENSDDFAYVRKPSVGTEILIFDGAEYPLLEGGAVRVQIAPRNCSAYYTVSTRAQYTSRNLDYFSEAWRGCRTPSVHSSRWRRSYSWCLLECRRYAALQLCGCVPFTWQPRKEQICTLNELSCLNKHREKFLAYHPFGYKLETPSGEALSEELQDALVCAHCRADCARPVYTTTTSYATYQQRDLFKNRFAHGVELTNVSVLRFFYSTEDQHLYAVECNSEWYETFASIGSQWYTLLGISVVTLFELVFHCTVRWRHHYVRRNTLFANIAPSDIH